MVADVQNKARRLPDRWKARLNDQPQVEVDPRRAELDQIADIAPESTVVVMEPTEPATPNGLPAFKIRQEIAPQPTAEEVHSSHGLADLRTSVIVTAIACCGVAVIAGALLAIAL